VNRLVSFIYLLLFASVLSFGQSQMVITGTVTDVTTKAPLANVIVTLANKDTAIETKTDNAGKYSFTFLKPDKIYVLSALFR
jgi:hypothetical protein